MKTKITTPLLRLALVLLFAIAGTAANAQSAVPVTRSYVLNEPTHIQKKILDNTPNLYEISDLINYPLAVEEDRQRPGIQYITVNDFYNSSLSRKMDIIVYTPNTYYIAADSSSIPPLRVMSEEQIEQKTNQQ